MMFARSNFGQRLELFKSKISWVLQDATKATPGSVSVRLDRIQSLLGNYFTEKELKDPLNQKVIMTFMSLAMIGKAVPIPAKKGLVWPNTSDLYP
jgi:hypothetical protein